MSEAPLHIRPIIGLEIHVQLATRTKMFCPCPVEFAAEPNSRVCPVCMGLPGSLPVMNRAAVEHAIRAGLALGCQVADFTKWDRKSYYYPDLPKNYQISQYDLPLSRGGRFDIPLPDGSMKPIRIIRAHLEEDAGKNLHEGLDHTRVDLNRAGTPLLEIVTEPDLTSADEAYTFCVELQRLVRWLGISEANMQKGQMRFEPNVNVAITENGVEHRTPICEIKNLNSFRSVRSAIAYEIDRHVAAWKADHDYTLEKKGKMNLGWDDVREVTEFQRGKEESHDYRYFPDPDLAPVRVDKAWTQRLRGTLGELPLAKERRLMAQLGVSAKDCEIILADRPTADLFEAALAAKADAKTLVKQFVGVWNHLASARGVSVGNLVISLSRISDQDAASSEPTPQGVGETQGDSARSTERDKPLSVAAGRVAELANIVAAGQISATAAAQVAEKLLAAGGTRGPLDIARDAGLLQERDEGAMAKWVDEALAANPQAVADALGSNAKKAAAAPGFLRGQVMKLSGGKADPKLAGELIEKKLGELRSANGK